MRDVALGDIKLLYRPLPVIHTQGDDHLVFGRLCRLPNLVHFLSYTACMCACVCVCMRVCVNGWSYLVLVNRL